MIDEATKKKLLEKYSANLTSSKNKNHYLSYARHFLDNASGLDRLSIEQYIESLRKNYSPGTVNFRFRVIRTLFEVNKLDWEFRQGEAPTIKQRDEHRPQLSIESIEAMITAAKNGKLFPYEQCFVALSTTYGLRRGEMANLRPEDVHLDKVKSFSTSCNMSGSSTKFISASGALYIATLKFGRERYHLIPPEIMPYIENHDFNERYAVATLNVIFKRILLKCKIRLSDIGWHSIRRALVDGLDRNGVSDLDIQKFMRWKSATEDMAMPARYHGNVIVGLGATTPALNEAKRDEEIFEKHPFLPFWRDSL